MKKLTVIILLLAVLFGVSTAYIAAEVNSGKDKVSFEENVLYGDKTYANGITLTMEANYKRKLNWKTDYTVGLSPKCETEYRFSAEGIPDDDREYYGIDISENIGDLKVVSDAYDEAVKTSKEEKRSVTVTLDLSDHIEYFPLFVYVDLPNFTLSYENQQRLIKKVNEFFKTPVPDNFNITITAEDEGTVTSIGYDAYTDTQFTGVAITPDTVFFTKGFTKFSPKDHDNTIYSINYGKDVIYEDTLKSAYDPGENFIISEMFATDKTLVLLGTDNDCETTFLQVLDIQTMNCIQNIKVSDSGYVSSRSKEDFIEIETRNDSDDYEIYFYKLLPDNTYTHGMTVREKGDFFGDYITAIDFDGQHAVFAQAIHPHIAGSDAHFDVLLSVYDQSGRVYLGEYKCNLSKHNKSGYRLADYGYSLDVNMP